MTATVRRSSRLVFVLALVAVMPAAAQDEKPAATILPTRAPGNVFGDRDEVEYKFRIDATRAVKGRVAWRLALGTATVQAGEVAVDVAPGEPQDVAFKLTRLPGKDGAIVHSKLTLAVIDAGANKTAGAYEQDLWVFPKDPFAGRSEWLKKLKIHLYDPTTKAATAKVFEKANVPFEQLRSVDAVADVRGGLVIVGEGVSFKEERGLAAALQKVAAGGGAVLILAPAEGEVIVPGLGGPAGLEDLTFRREVVRRLDKRLDPNWTAVASSIRIKQGDDGVVGEVTAGPGGWPWVEARYGGKGRWAACGLAVIAKWDDGPTTRFFLARMLEYLTDSKTEQPKKENE